MTNAQRAFPGHQPLVDRRERLLGYRLSGVDVAGGELEEHLGAHGLRDLALFVDVPSQLLQDPCLGRLDAARYVVQVTGEPPDDDAFGSDLAQLRRRSMRLSIGNATPGSPWLGRVSKAAFARVDVSRLPHSHLARYATGLKRLGPKLIAAGLRDRRAYRAAVEAGFDCFEGHWFTQPQTRESRTVAPIYGSVLRTLSLVRTEASLAVIERSILGDPTLAFKLLRYVNSAAFGLRSEVHSPKDAIQLLGYRPLARWLGLALVTAHVDAGSNAAMAATAITRGRMMELIEAGARGRTDTGDAFMVGLFSVMDAMFDMPMQRVVETLSPPMAVAQALLERQGSYGVLLRLVEACESPAPADAAELAHACGVDAAMLCAAQLEALAWGVRLNA